MNTDGNDAHPGGSLEGLPRSVVGLFAETGVDPDGATSPPQACASCGEAEGLQWLRTVTEWEDAMCADHDVPRPDGVCLIPLCSRCRAWAELLEIAEMATPHRAGSRARRVIQERNRFLETLSVELVRGIRVSEELSSYSE